MAAAPEDFRHPLPDFLRGALDSDPALQARWDDLTPLARNEWICWTTSPKKQETREAHFARLKEEVLAGKRRPCCWPGCPHRRKSAEKWFNRSPRRQAE